MDMLTYTGLAVPKRLAASFAKVKKAIERDDLRSPDVKKLTGRPFFRAKLDYDSRLLLQFVRHRGRTVCLALEILESHAYDRSRFLRGARIDEGAFVVEDDATAESVHAGASPVRYLHPGRVDFELLDKPISFDDQQARLARLPLPLIVVGCAGSGKTALTLTKLRHLRGEILYVTQSPYLADNAEALYFAHGYENEGQSVDFLSYRKLLESIRVPAGRPVTLRDFRPFFERHRGSFRFTTAPQLFEELRGVLTAGAEGPLSREAYLALGVRQSIYAEADRPAAHDALAKYRAWLAEAGLYDPNLVAHELRPLAEPRYDAVVVDEIQDLTIAELGLVLATLKDPRGFLLCGDANQIVHPNFFSWSKVKSLFYSDEEARISAPIHVLEANYRSSVTVSELANTLLKVKNARFGSVDRESTALVRPASEIEGRVAGLVAKDAALRRLGESIRGSARVAVLVLSDEQKAEAKKRFATPLIFSVHEAKGLEYETVILFELISSERAAFREIAAGVTQADVDVTDLTFARAKDKGDKSLEVFKFYVNSLYVALTRAVETVYVVESDIAHPLLGLLRLTFSEDIGAFRSKASTLEEWQKEARRLELQGKTEQADAIRTTILKATPVPWAVLDDAGLAATYAKVFAPNSVFTKAKAQLFEFAAFHEISPLADAVTRRAGFVSPKDYRATIPLVRSRLVASYAGPDATRVLADVARYGLEHRNIMAMTPLMMAAFAGNVPLVETLLDRGARVDAVDTFGRMPVHFALARAAREPAFATESLGPLYDLLCPNGIDLEVEDHLVRLSRAQGEFFVLAMMLAVFHHAYGAVGYRSKGFTTAALDPKVLDPFPRSIVPEHRRKRAYWNAVLARGEVDSTYRPARRLWRREAHGSYVPSEAARLRVTDGEGREHKRSLHELLRVGFLDEHMVGRPWPRVDAFVGLLARAT
jgi:hypothetical protein